MDNTKQEWPKQNGRVEFHLTGGFTKISIWVGGLHQFDLPTREIPADLRVIGTWLSLRMDKEKWWVIEGRGEPDPYIERWMHGEKDL
ncbi:MAG: hypothetical protein JSS69_01900 [Acidobacteria bacterium]|nr:hypothetical protein [Acidobacteriota bacterium]MBS1864646.1 hypothetical protein [Acidobacteriota bacterium]